MLEIRVPIAEVQVGDVICDCSTDFVEETITKAAWPVDGDYHFETDKHNAANGNTWRCTSMYAPIVRFTKAYVPAKRIADELERFDRRVILEAMKFFCTTCGARGCGEHA